MHTAVARRVTRMLVLGVLLATAVGVGLPAPADAAETPILVVGRHTSTFSGQSNCDDPAIDLNLTDTIYYPKQDSIVIPDGAYDYFHLRSYCGNYLGLVTISVRDVEPGSDPVSPAGRTRFDVRMQLYRFNSDGSTTHCHTATWGRTHFDGHSGANYMWDNRWFTACGVTWSSSQHVEYSPV